jgi:hypothetical protein
MLYKVALVSAMLGVCSGFAPAPVVPRTAVMQRAGAVFMQETEEKAADTETKEKAAAPAAVEYAESLPMLVKRPQLKGYVGDVGFDPLGFSEILPMVRSACRLSHRARSQQPCGPQTRDGCAARRGTLTVSLPPSACQDWLREAELKHCRVSMLAFVGMIFTDFYTLPGYEFSTLEAHDAGVANGSMSQLLLWLGLLEFFSFIGIDQMLRGSGREPGDYGATHHVATLCSHAT